MYIIKQDCLQGDALLSVTHDCIGTSPDSCLPYVRLILVYFFQMVRVEL